MKKGGKMSEETKLKVSLNRKGKGLGNKNGFTKGFTPWNKDKTMSDSMREKMKGNTHGHANKNRIWKKETLERMSQAQYRRRLRENPNYIPDGGSELRTLHLKQNGGFHSKGEWENLLAQYNWTCPACHRSKPEIQLTKDHIIPASKGGSNNIENIQPLCKSCNSKKHDKIIKY